MKRNNREEMGLKRICEKKKDLDEEETCTVIV